MARQPEYFGRVVLGVFEIAADGTGVRDDALQGVTVLIDAILEVGEVVYLVQNAVNTPLESLVGLDGGMLTAEKRGVYRVRCLERLWCIVPTWLE